MRARRHAQLLVALLLAHLNLHVTLAQLIPSDDWHKDDEKVDEPVGAEAANLEQNEEEMFEPISVIVKTDLGKVEGVRRGSVDFFGNLPFAAPPVGKLRWAPPELPAPWKPHILDATGFGPDCWQITDPVLNPIKGSMSEDCLYLNIYTPAGQIERRQLLPVMVWFHGGAFQQGGARRPEYNGRRIAERDMVVVTINYRLGALGFLVSSEDKLFGNFGLMDQRAALHWIQEHVQSFGGDPQQITLFGESAGAVMIGLHLLMDNTGHYPNHGPEKNRLFHKAIMQSNPLGYKYRSVVVADFLGSAFKRSVDCRDLECLRNEPVEELMRAQSSLMGIPRSVGDFFTWGPVLTLEWQVHFGGNADSYSSGAGGSGILGGGQSNRDRFPNLENRMLFRVDQFDSSGIRQPGRRRRSRFLANVTQTMERLVSVPDDIPIIIGTNAHEGEMFVHSAFPLTMSKAVYWMFVGALFKDSAQKVLKHYRPYVKELERKARAVAEKQVEEEENKQFYFENREELEREYEVLLALNASSSTNHIVSPDTVQRLVDTMNAGGGQELNSETLKKMLNEEYSGQASSHDHENTEADPGGSSWRHKIWPFAKASIEQRMEQEEKRKQKMKDKALKAAAKVVIDYRPVMSRIIDDYLFRCPAWLYAQTVSKNRVSHGEKNNVYVYRFSQPTHIPLYEECWGKSCHTAELPYVFQSMHAIRSSYSTLSPIAQKEAPTAPEYPYTEMLSAYRGAVEKSEFDEEEEPNTQRKVLPHWTNHTRSFRRLLKHLFDDYFVEDADYEISRDMAERWVAFARDGNPNYNGARSRWVPWRYIPVDKSTKVERKVNPWDEIDYLFWNNITMTEEDIEGATVDGGYSWSNDPEERAYRRRALQALGMEVADQDTLRTELRRKPNGRESDDKSSGGGSSFTGLVASLFGVEYGPDGGGGDTKLPARTIQRIQRIAQEIGVLGTGLNNINNIDERRTYGQSMRWSEDSFSSSNRRSAGSNNLDDDFFPQLLDLKWPPEERLVERDCTCDFWERIRYRY